MVTIKIHKDSEQRHIVLKAEGHAGAGDHGRDPVCAGISAHMIGFAGAVRIMVDNGLVNKTMTRVCVGGTPGQGRIETVCATDEAYNRLLDALMPAEQFFQGLAESKPNNVKLLYHPCGE